MAVKGSNARRGFQNFSLPDIVWFSSYTRTLFVDERNQRVSSGGSGKEGCKEVFGICMLDVEMANDLTALTIVIKPHSAPWLS